MLRPIRTEKDHRAALTAIDELWNAKPGTDAYDGLEILTALVEVYERVHHPIDPPDPIEA